MGDGEWRAGRVIKAALILAGEAIKAVSLLKSHGLFGKKCLSSYLLRRNFAIVRRVLRWASARFLFVGQDLWDRNMDVLKVIETTVTGLGYELVDVERGGGGMLTVYLDSPEGIDVNDCQIVSNQLTRLFLVENIDYSRLEVSSPGLDRPLKKDVDFVRFAGEKAKFKLRMPINGQKNFVGLIGELGAGVLQLDVDGVLVAIELANVDKARLVPTF